MFFIQKLYFSCFHSHFFHLIIEIRKTGRIFYTDINAEPTIIKGDSVFQFLKISYNNINCHSRYNSALKKTDPHDKPDAGRSPQSRRSCQTPDS